MCIYILYTYYIHIIDVYIHQAGLGIDLQWVPEVPIPPVLRFPHLVMISPYSHMMLLKILLWLGCIPWLSHNPRTNRCR